MRRFPLLIALFTLALGGLGWASAAAGRIPGPACNGPCEQSCMVAGMDRQAADLKNPPCHRTPAANDCAARPDPGDALVSVGTGLETKRMAALDGSGNGPGLPGRTPGIARIADRKVAEAAPGRTPARNPLSALERTCVLRI